MNFVFIKGNKGQIGQIITSLVIVFVVFFLMLTFVIVSNNIAGLIGLFDEDDTKGVFRTQRIAEISSEKIGSRVLMDLFLSDRVEFNGNDVLIIEVLESIRDYDEGLQLEVLNKTQKSFSALFSRLEKQQ